MEPGVMLALRAFQDTDEERFRAWLYTDHVAKWYKNPLAWLHEVEQRNGAYAWIHHRIVELDNTPIGFCQYYEYRESGEAWHGDIAIEGAYSIDYLIGEAACLGKGYGKAIIQALISEISLRQNARLIIVQPEPENKASCSALLSAGFTFDQANRLYKYTLPPH